MTFFSKLLDKLRTLFSNNYREFKEYLIEHEPEIAEKAINYVIEKYSDIDGDQKMEFAIQFVLEAVHIPAIYAIFSSKLILQAVKYFIQDKYDDLKQSGKL